MSKQANPFTIGLFVLGAIIMALGAVVVFGTGKYLQRRPACIVYFEGSVNGLRVGAPVTLRGVQIGEVTRISLLALRQRLNFLIPVTVEFDPAAVERLEGESLPPSDFLPRLIAKGLRAQLQSQSFVTGMLFVNLDFFPGTPAKIVGADPSLPEIPTIPSKLEELSRTFESLPIKESLNSFNATLDAISRIVQTDEAREFLPKLNKVLDESAAAVKDAKGVLRALNDAAGPAAANLSQAAAAAASAARHAEGLFIQGEELTSENSDIRSGTAELLKSLTRVMRSVRELADYLERNPTALIFGRTAEEKEHAK